MYSRKACLPQSYNSYIALKLNFVGMDCGNCTIFYDIRTMEY